MSPAHVAEVIAVSATDLPTKFGAASTQACAALTLVGRLQSHDRAAGPVVRSASNQVEDAVWGWAQGQVSDQGSALDDDMGQSSVPRLGLRRLGGLFIMIGISRFLSLQTRPCPEPCCSDFTLAPAYAPDG